MSVHIAKELNAVLALVRAVYVCKDDGAPMRVMNGNELSPIGIGAPEAADAMDGPSGNGDVGATRLATTASLTRPNATI